MSATKQSKYGYLKLLDAYKDVKEKGIAIRRAAKVHGLPESTLRWRLANEKKEDLKHGGQNFFTRAQEEMLAEHCVSMAHLGYGFTRWQVLDMAKNMSEAVGKDTEPTKHWFYGFLTRFPELKMVHPKKREKARDEAVNQETLKGYFDALGEVLDKYDIKNKPQFIWNVDETGISLDHNPPKILARAGSNPHCITSGKSATTTVIAAVSGLGETLPPFVIFKGERLSSDIRTEGLNGTEYRSSQTGWSNSELFLDFFTNHFMHHVTARPCILLYDGHSTHVTFDVIEAARQENIHLFVLPPHSSHCLQPLDVSVFSPFKRSLSSECHKYLHAHPNRVIVKEDLPRIIGTAFKNSLTVSTIMSGFRKTGIFPFDPSAPCVTPPEINKEKNETKPTRKERKDNRSVKILFQEKSDEFNQQKESVELKKKRSGFVPPYGAAITEESYYEKKKCLAEEKKEKEEKKEMNKKVCKRKIIFTPPYSQQETSYQSLVDGQLKRSEETETKKSKKEINSNKENKVKEIQKKGKGPLANSKRGKGPAKKDRRKKLTVSNEFSEDETEVCVMCGKFQPDDLNLDQSIKFVNWGNCVICNKWVHLKFCCSVETLKEEDEFLCPKCDHEQ